MATLKEIPTGNLPYEVVDKLPKKGEENKIYGVPMGEDIPFNTDYRWHNGEWEEVDLGASVFGFQFADYQESVQEVVAEMQEIIEAQEQKIQELEQEVFPSLTTSFEMMITSLMMVDLDLYDENGEIVPNNGLSVEYFEEPTELVYQTGEIRKGTYYLKNSDGYALGKPNGDIQPLICEGGIVNLGNVEVIMLAPKKGGKK